MKNKKLALYAALVCTWLVCVPKVALASDENILKDPSFELELAPDQGGWVLFDESRFASDSARSGQQSMFNWGFSQNVAFPPFVVGTVSGSYQEFPAAPGSRWRMTGFGVAPNAIKGASAFGVVQVSFFDAAGKDLGTVETAGSKTAKARTSNQVNARTPAGKWILLDTGIVTAPEGTETIQAFTLYVDYSGSNIAQGVYFDDLSLCALDDDDNGQLNCIDNDS